MRYDTEVNADHGIPLPQLSIVLPLTMNKRCAEAIHTKQMTAGSFFRALAEDRTLAVGLQQRLQSHAERTFRALNLSFASGLLRLDGECLEAFPGRRSLPGNPSAASLSEDLRHVLAASKRIGYWLAVTDFGVLCNLLKIRY